MTVRFFVHLSKGERGALHDLNGGGRQAVRKIKRAQILLAADAIRHGHGPERVIQTGIGPVEFHRIKVRNRAFGPAAERIRFSSALLPW